MHLSLTCLYSYCFTVQKYAETTRNDYFYNGTCLLAALVFPLTTNYDYRLLLPANGRRDFFIYQYLYSESSAKQRFKSPRIREETTS